MTKNESEKKMTFATTTYSVLMVDDELQTFYILTPIGLKNPRKTKKAEREIAKKNFKALFSTSKKEYDEKHQELIDKGYTWYAR